MIIAIVVVDQAGKSAQARMLTTTPAVRRLYGV